MALRKVSLDQKYTLDDGQIYITGTQALVRLPMMQHRIDKNNGLNTGGFISGYRGSPLGGYDQALWAANGYLEEHNIKFTPGINEDLGATAVWGSQQSPLFKGSKVDGVFGIWYGKGPGVDRTGDVFKHANMSGTSQYGGVLALAGDDHTCKSSTLPHQSEFAFMDASIPVLVPSNVQDILDLGLFGWAMSRYSGCWIGFKVIADTIDTSSSVAVGGGRIKIKLPEYFEMPEGGLNIRWPDDHHVQEKRLRLYKLEAAKAFVHANGLDRIIWKSKKPRLGIVTCGKSYHDVRQALDNLGISPEKAEDLGISLYKVAMSWPLEPLGIRSFARGHETLLVVEEKRALIESQAKDILYNLPAKERPIVIGKLNQEGKALLPETNELHVPEIAHVIAQQILHYSSDEGVVAAYKELDKLFKAQLAKAPEVVRLPYYCSGCPHNTSTTQLPEGSRAVAGIGCHYMAQWIAPGTTSTYTQMGGEGVPWVGLAPFSEESHIFANLGDGTYYHSGLLAIRAAVASKVNITYKILYNDAVAMTGGQHVDGPLDVPMITRQLYAEGVRCIKVVSDDPWKYKDLGAFASGVTIDHRDDLAQIQEDIKRWPGVSAIVYDQTCAAEKRRRRKRGLMEDPNKRVFINSAVCEGCGDCSVKSNCLSVQPIETEMGRKRRIDQSSCNKDYSCLKGFCPSFVTVEGGGLKKAAPPQTDLKHLEDLPKPKLPSLDQPYSIFVTGVGGTGVITVGALIGMAAHLDGKGCSIVDMAGLAQKGGAVVSHLRVAKKPEDIHATRVTLGSADILFGADMVVAGYPDSLGRTAKGKTKAIINDNQTITGHFIGNPDYDFKHESIKKNIDDALGAKAVDYISATDIASKLLGDTIMANLFMLGFAYQKGYIPVSHEALEEAIRLNNVAIPSNINAFRWGRFAAVDMVEVIKVAHINDNDYRTVEIPEGLEAIIKHRMQYLTKYQNMTYAKRYEKLVRRVEAVDKKLGIGEELSIAVAKYYAKLLAYKDEYEVARLYTDGNFMRDLRREFGGNFKLSMHLAPPLFAEKDLKTGHLVKKTFGPWMLSVFRIMAKFKGLRGSKLDIFGYSKERKIERALIVEYESVIETIINLVDKGNYDVAVEIASIPEHIRGFGHVKMKNIHDAQANRAALLSRFLSGNEQYATRKKMA